MTEAAIKGPDRLSSNPTSPDYDAEAIKTASVTINGQPLKRVIWYDIPNGNVCVSAVGPNGARVWSAEGKLHVRYMTGVIRCTRGPELASFSDL